MTELETAKMSERGQIIIPKEVREFIDAKKSTIFTVMPLDKDTIIMKKLNKEQIVKEFRAIRSSVKDKLTAAQIDEEIQKSRQ